MPTCIVRATSPKDVSLAVKTLVGANKVGNCQFAVRGGGHTPWAGASNIQNGVTIDLSLMNSTIYNKENSTASVGPGARWQGVYEVLDKLGVAIPGGRAGTVGVAGLTLGGFLSPAFDILSLQFQAATRSSLPVMVLSAIMLRTSRSVCYASQLNKAN